MTKRLVRNYFKDRLLFICFYLIASGSTVLYYFFVSFVRIDIFYPMLINFFLLSAFLCLDSFTYFQSNRSCLQLLQDEEVNWIPLTEEQKVLYQLVQRQQQQHSKQFYQLQAQQQERLYFLSHWMHHLKAPISTMQLLTHPPSFHRNIEKNLQTIRTVNQKMNHAIEQALTMLRIDRFEKDVELKSVNIVEVVQQQIDALAEEWEQHRLVPEFVPEETALFVATDLKWNAIILQQCMHNAIKYSTREHAKVQFNISATNDEIALAITDEGIGIPAYDMEYVFEPFFTGENGRKIANASGIGLYLCKKIADYLNHRVTISSDVGKGTTVTIYWKKVYVS